MHIHDEKGRRVSLDSLGLIGLKLLVPPPSFEYEMEDIEGMPGEMEVDRKLKSREIVASLWSKSDSYEDSFRTRDLLYSFLANQKYFYIGDVEGKRWRVLLSNWTLDRINSFYHSIEMPISAPSGTAESVNIISRSFDENLFTFKNEGTVFIDMRQQIETEITFKGASNNLTITNHSTGDVWKYNGTTIASDTILLKGVRSFKNGQSIFGNTNKKLISFAPGNNKIEISGASDFELIISTRFYFL